jgi:glycosyltransferase involved in cell wall biosynthesis
VDRNKGCETLLEYFQEYAATAAPMPLVLAGPIKMQIPTHPKIRALGYVSDELRAALLSHASLLVVPSPYESLGIALLEGWNHGIPALVNARCDVLREQVRRADGGLHYRSFNEFCEAMDYLASHPDERRALGAQGLRFVEREYRWQTVLPRVEALLRTLSRTQASPAASSST